MSERLDSSLVPMRTVIAILLLLAIVAGGTLAYLVSARKVDNDISIGQNTITIKEDWWPPKELTLGENQYRKAVAVANTGTVPCYIRVLAAFSDLESEERSYLSHDGGTTFTPAGEYSTALPENWVYIDEGSDSLLGGYYYYTLPVEPGQSTSQLFDTVRTVYDNAEDISQYEIIVYAESVQVLDWQGNYMTSALAAWKSFLERR